MFAGHIGAALLVGRVERRVGLGWLVGAALLLDLVLWILILSGTETVAIPPDFAAHHQPHVEFPWSHGLAAAAIWSAVAGVVAALLTRSARWAMAATVAAATFSHWLLDVLVHRPELPLLAESSTRVGLGLWDHLEIALAFEVGLVVAGLLVWVPGSGLSKARAWALVLLVLAVTTATVLGMTVAPPPPSAAAMAASSLGMIALVVGLVAWLTRPAGRARAEESG